jgi:MraZ protein
MPDTANNMPNFHEAFVYGIDSSRRVMVPARWRPEDKKTVFTALAWPIIGPTQHILVLPPDRWRLMLDKLKTQSLMDGRVAALERRIGAASAELVMDPQGRFCLPDSLVQAAGLGKEAQFVGRLDKFEIWNPERYQASSLADAELAASVAREINL